MTGIDPSVIPAHEIVDHPMGVAVLKRSQENFFAVGLAISIAIGKPVNIGNTVSDRSVINREYTDRYI